MELNFEEVFKIPIAALNFNRTHPFIKKDKKWFLQAALVNGSYSLLLFLIFYNLIWYDLKINNFSQICKNGVLVAVFIIVTMQYFVLVYHQNTLKSLINYVKRDYEMLKSLTLDEQKIVTKYANQGTYVCKLWLYLAIAGFTAFPAKHIFVTAYNTYINEFKLLPFYNFYYPGIIDDNKNNIFIYSLLYVYLNACSVHAAVMYTAYVPLGQSLIIHACGQLEIAKTRIDNLFVCQEINEEIIQKKLESIVKQLQYVHSFVNLIMEVFRIAYDLTHKTTTLVLPVTMYQGLQTAKQGEFSLEFVTFIFGSVLISTSPCFYSQLLMDKGYAVRDSLYSCGWEKFYDRRTRLSLQILLQYALRPVAIRTVFRTLCLEALTDLFQQSYAIFNFMNAMWE